MERVMRISNDETKTHYRSRAGLDPVPRYEQQLAKTFIVKAIDLAIANRWKAALDDERDALKKQRNRVAKFLGVDS
jgi:hypothetical protein